MRAVTTEALWLAMGARQSAWWSSAETELPGAAPPLALGRRAGTESKHPTRVVTTATLSAAMDAV
eukprot:410461-Rhodomonas_salina.1